ncbi:MULTISPECIES: NADPH-dependent F420 reductase [Pseudomonas]|uniref:NAD(P)-binding domain-containing protein n=1 Tax=Pseudomonas citronellolis TaxID=53408 RepID=A0A127MUY8_9PSED|nr:MULTISPECIES: NAD(P)-binding domain-containing protein [Pseudomonas]KSW22423.1 NADP oxidoreductase [Pseudomonas sp. ADP]AMO77132.1 NADP oxidoreductase coenzyme F420-dependent [Pseudomonas citronellolis]ANI14711.1 NADP oxidoreductase [Pseudomonas citronellolis]KES22029.1 NADP oxidoreductase [Pseudomonas sp. AAC]KWR76176.1 NADP oxidoreductase [Pseudomonas sp. PI1]
MRIGIIGAGFIGRALAELGVKNGYEVMLSNSRGPHTLTSTMIALGCRIGSVEQAASFGDLLLLAIPFGRYRELPAQAFAGKIVLDANNYYPQRDGQFAELDSQATTTSELLAQHLQGARVVKAFNAILERDLVADARPAGAADRRALPIAGDDAQAKQAAAELHERFGYDVVDAGPLAEGWRFERARPAYCRRLDSAGLRAALADTGPNQAEGAWRS